MSEEPSSFSLNGTDTGFSSRSQDVFSSLATIEAKHDAFQKASGKTTRRDAEALIKDDPVVEDALRHRNPHAFKRPRGRPPPRRRWTPEYRQHPERWTKYDLSDVPVDQMSERSNTAAAMDFLNTQRKRHGENRGVDDAGHDTFQFKKPTVKVSCQSASLGKRSAATTDMAFGNSKLVMPEYVIGQSASKKRQIKRTTGQVKCDTVGLGHLTHSDDEDDEKGNASRKNAMDEVQAHCDASTSSSSDSVMEQCQSTVEHNERTTLDTGDRGVLSPEDVPSTDSVTTQAGQIAFKKSSKSRAHQRRARRDDDAEENDD